MLLSDVMNFEEVRLLECFVEADSELQRTQAALDADAFTFSKITGHESVVSAEEDFTDPETEVALGDPSLANPVLESFAA